MCVKLSPCGWVRTDPHFHMMNKKTNKCQNFRKNESNQSRNELYIIPRGGKINLNPFGHSNTPT